MRKVSMFLLCVLLCLSLTLTASAAVPPVFDQSQLLTDRENSELNVQFGKLREQEGYYICVVTTDSFDGMSAQDYAENFYDAHFGGDGVLLLVSLEEGWWYISTNGVCARQISDSQTDALGELLVPLIHEGEYAQAFDLFGREAVSLMHAEPEPAPEPNPWVAVLICLAVGLAAAGITTGIMASQMKTVRKAHGAGDYVLPGSMVLTNSHDIYLYHTVSRTAKPKSSSTGGRSRGGSGGRL